MQINRDPAQRDSPRRLARASVVCYARSVGLAVLLAALSACSAITISYDYDPDASFAELQSYGWIPEPKKLTGDPRIDHNTLLEKRIESAVERELDARGYVKKSSGTPDFWLAYYVTVDRKTTVTTLNAYYGYGPGWDWGAGYAPYGPYGRAVPYAYEYDEGTLILDVIDPETRELMWRGSATDEVGLSRGPKADEKQINEAVQRLLKHFPPGTKS